MVLLCVFSYVLDLTHDSFPLELWEKGAVYYHNHDKDGHKICELVSCTGIFIYRKLPYFMPFSVCSLRNNAHFHVQ